MRIPAEAHLLKPIWLDSGVSLVPKLTSRAHVHALPFDIYRYFIRCPRGMTGRKNPTSRTLSRVPKIGQSAEESERQIWQCKNVKIRETSPIPIPLSCVWRDCKQNTVKTV